MSYIRSIVDDVLEIACWGRGWSDGEHSAGDHDGESSVLRVGAIGRVVDDVDVPGAAGRTIGRSQGDGLRVVSRLSVGDPAWQRGGA